jgi:H+/Cl- antiporter ClcA
VFDVFDEHIFGSGKNIMSQVLFTVDKSVGLKTVLVRVIGPIICFNTGGAGGVFAPAPAAGAAVGASVSQLFNFVGANVNILILSGVVGLLTSVTRTPFTSAILVLEMTDRHSVIFHLMLAAMVANIVAIAAEKHSVYDQLKKEFI